MKNFDLWNYLKKVYSRIDFELNSFRNDQNNIFTKFIFFFFKRLIAKKKTI
jgi:hypothetical protein